MRRLVVASLSALTALIAVPALARAQDPGASVTDFDKKKGGSEKMHQLARIPAHDGAWKAADVELEQDRNRPYVYLCGFVNFDVTIYDISNTSAPKQIYPLAHRESRSCIAASARWTGSTSRSTGATTTRSRCSSCRARPTPTSAPSSSTSPVCPMRRRSRKSRAFGIRSRRVDSTTRSPTSTPTAARSTSRRSTSRRRSSTISRRS